MYGIHLIRPQIKNNFNFELQTNDYQIQDLCSYNLSHEQN